MLPNVNDKAEPYLVYFQPIVNALRMVQMFAGKNCQGLIILIVHPANDTPDTGPQQSGTMVYHGHS